MAGGGSLVLLYINVFLLIGVLMRHTFARLSSVIPYTVLLLLVGMVMGLGARMLRDAYDEIADEDDDSSAAASSSGSHASDTPLADDYLSALSMISSIEPHTLLYIFLPALLFESANAIESHVFRKVLGKALTLAFPAMFAGVALMALVVKALYPAWGWAACLLLGTITSATDPVAVVATLRELGAKPSLSTTIEGESLLNDGTAVVFFVLLKEIVVVGEMKEWWWMAWDFVRMAGGGPLIGWAWGVVSLAWILRVFNDSLVEITISITSAYLAYYVSENSLGSSGVLTVVTLGLCYGSTLGRTCISPEVIHFLHEFWETLGYLANTVIFVLTGVVILYNTNFAALELWDIAVCALVYVGATVVRFLLFALTFPLFRKMHYGWSWKEALIAAWGGLRGAVGLALALDVSLTPGIDAAVRDRILCVAAAMVVLTLAVNASTLRPLLGLLRYVELTREEVAVLHAVSHRLQAQSDAQVAEIKEDPFLSHCEWAVVRRYADLGELFAPLLKGGALAAVDHGATAARASAASATSSAGDLGLEQLNTRLSMAAEASRLSAAARGRGGAGGAAAAAGEAMVAEVRHKFHMSLRAQVWHLQHSGQLGAVATDRLVAAIDRRMDDRDGDWLRWEQVEGIATLPPAWIQRLQHSPLLGAAARRFIMVLLSVRHDLALGFLTVHLHLAHDDDATAHWSHDEEIVRRMHDVIEANIEAARRSLIDLHEVLPEVCMSINTRQTTRCLLHGAREKIQEMSEAGMIPPNSASTMVAQVETQMRRLQWARLSVQPTKDKLLRELPWTKHLDEPTFAMLLDAAKERVYKPNDFVLRVHETDECVHLIARGIVRIVDEATEDEPEKLIAIRGAGVILGEQSLLTGAPRAASARASTSVLVFELPHGALLRAMEACPPLDAFLWRQAGLNLAHKLLARHDEHEAEAHECRPLSSEELTALADEWVPSDASIKKADAGTAMPLATQTMLLHGVCVEYAQHEAPPTEKELDELRGGAARAAAEGVALYKLAHRRQHIAQRRLGEGSSLGNLRKNSLLGGAGEPSVVGAGGAAAGGGRGAAGAFVGKEGQRLWVSSKWILHQAPCLIAPPPGGRSAGVDLLFVSPSRVVTQPLFERSRAPSIADAYGGTTGRSSARSGSVIEESMRADGGVGGVAKPKRTRRSSIAVAAGTPLASLAHPHPLRPSVFALLSRHAEPRRFIPGQPLVGGPSSPPDSLLIVTNGRVLCSVAADADGAAAAPAAASHALGLPFDRCLDLGAVPLPMVSGALLGEWLLLRPPDALRSSTVAAALAEMSGFGGAAAPAPAAAVGGGERRRVVAHSEVTCQVLPEFVVSAAVQADERLRSNLQWAEAQRGAYCVLRELEPCGRWHASKLWRWLHGWHHVVIDRAGELLGVDWHVVVLVSGTCSLRHESSGGSAGASYGGGSRGTQLGVAAPERGSSADGAEYDGDDDGAHRPNGGRAVGFVEPSENTIEGRLRAAQHERSEESRRREEAAPAAAAAVVDGGMLPESPKSPPKEAKQHSPPKGKQQSRRLVRRLSTAAMGATRAVAAAARAPRAAHTVAEGDELAAEEVEGPALLRSGAEYSYRFSRGSVLFVPTADALRLLPAGWEFARIEGRQLDELSRQQWISPAAERTSNALWC